MSRLASWIVALVGLALLTVLCVRCHGPQIEAELAAGTAAALGEEAMDGVDVALDGRDVVLTGLADSDEERVRYGALAAGVRGVRAVDNRLRIAGEADLSAAGFSLADGADGVVVRGAVPDEEARAALLAAVEARFPGREVRDEITVGAAAAAGWQPGVIALLGALGEVPAGTLSDGGIAVEPDADGDGGAIVLRGRVPDADAKTQAEARAAEAVTPPWTVRSELVVGASAAAADSAAAGTQVELADPGDPDVQAAQMALREVFAVGAVEFETGTSRLTDASLDLLDEASGVLRRFGSVTAEVQGHTDSEGGAASNLRLSEQRADAVRRYLSDAGVERDRLTVRGFGEDEPIASNDTPEGRARNRRVVFRLGAE